MTEQTTDYLSKWYYRYPWTRVLMFCYCLMCSFVGLIGLAPGGGAPSIAQQLGFYAVMFYSWILIVFGITGAVGIFRSIHATVVSLWAIAAATFFHGAAILLEGSAQTGLRLMIAPIMMVPLAWSWKQWLELVKHVSNLSLPSILTWRRKSES